MEIGEDISVVEPLLDESEGCPFEHERPRDDETKNVFIGDSKELEENMASGYEGTNNGVGTHPESPYKGLEEDPNPRPTGENGAKITIELNIPGEEGPHWLRYAAHHLIPAQESLADDLIPIQELLDEDSQPEYDSFEGHPLLNFMCGKGKVQKFKNDEGHIATTKVWANVGYNVNGGQNGVWLPAPYGAPDLLKGANHRISNSEPQWAYVKAAMDIDHVQFHDWRHIDYSLEVTKYLTKLATAYRRFNKLASECTDCSPDGEDPELVAPPRDLVQRLVQCSEFFRSHSVPDKRELSAKNIYTSRWVKEWIKDDLREREEWKEEIEEEEWMKEVEEIRRKQRR